MSDDYKFTYEDLYKGFYIDLVDMDPKSTRSVIVEGHLRQDIAHAKTMNDLIEKLRVAKSTREKLEIIKLIQTVPMYGVYSHMQHMESLLDEKRP